MVAQRPSYQQHMCFPGVDAYGGNAFMPALSQERKDCPVAQTNHGD